MEYAGFSWTAGARKHRVSRGLAFVRPATPPDRPDEAPLFVGDDERGTRLEVVGVELADGTLWIIHAMAMRAGYTTCTRRQGNGGSEADPTTTG